MMNGLPILPAITDQDLVLAVFAQEILGPSNDSEYGEPRRLAQLGKRVLDQAITYHYFKKTDPTLSADDIDVRNGFLATYAELSAETFQNQRLLNAPNYVDLLHHYNLRNKIRGDPEYLASLDRQEGAQSFFEKYMGAVFLLHGLSTIQEWVSQCIEPGCQTPLVPGQSNTHSHHTRSMSGSFGQTQPQPPPPPPGQPPPPPPSYYSGTPPPPPQQPIPPVPIQTNFQILAQFNMTAHQRGYTVTYPARSEGPHHTPVWHVDCCLNGDVRGMGSGKNQKQAKEMAARQAWIAMGWGHCPSLNQFLHMKYANPPAEPPVVTNITAVSADESVAD
ncbi:hypothetical protein NP233_g8845 [Leucocoprinus birnbaumii]|uniref:DRBM domain-containing protein n=1 Tax=Leucocoprinus birnbaumii TaxID=56174 RepID=A0AAD5YMR9_9AGAR|nr:hypothetical protein NP233_g8845 [Leucocoprinus birnbaumii]